MVRELEARIDQDLPAAARGLRGELACGWDSREHGPLGMPAVPVGVHCVSRYITNNGVL